MGTGTVQDLPSRSALCYNIQLNSTLWHYLVCPSVGLGCAGFPMPERSDSVTGGPPPCPGEQHCARTKSPLLAAR